MENDSEINYSEIQDALSSIGRSALLLLGATFLSQGLGFLTRITMARYLPVDGYGNVVVGLSILNLLGLASLIGMPAALSRYLPREETELDRREVLISALQIVGILSIVLAFAVQLAAEPVARIIFNNEDLVWIIRIFGGILPFYALLRLSVGGFRGYKKTYPRIVAENVLRPGLQLLGILLFVSLGYDTAGIAFAYGLAFILTALISAVLLYHISDISPGELVSTPFNRRYKTLIAFSAPLVAASAMSVFAKHSDLLILAFFKSSTEVGLYEVTFRMAIFLKFLFAPAIGYLFQPLMSEFDAEIEYRKMEKLYTVATRWIVFLSFPVFTLFFIFPEQTLVFFFGPKYQGGQTAFEILLVGFMISLLPGLTGNFLIAVGRTRLVMLISTGTMVVNVLINVLLIPIYGIIGAAIATAAARSFNNGVQSYIIFRYYDIHPFKYNLILPFSLMVVVLLVVISAPTSGFTFPEGVALSAVLGGAFLLIILLTRSIYAVEVTLLDALLERIGIDIPLADKFQWSVR